MNLSTSMSAPDALAERYTRLRATATFRDGGFERWSRTSIAVFGGGALGSLVATGGVRSGVTVAVFDFDRGSIENLGSQLVEPGVPKVDTVVAACDSINPGHARGFFCDARHAGIGLLSKFDLFIDATDDPNLALPLTEISNGLGRALLRCAVDGSGRIELGRVLCSSEATGHACQICNYDIEDLRPGRPRATCPGPEAQRPTIAGGALSMVVAGITLLSAQRIATGNDAGLVYGQETTIDLTNLQLLPIKLRRSAQCLSGHRRWELDFLEAEAKEITLDDLFGMLADRLSTRQLTFSCHLHPLNLGADCACGEAVAAVGTDWSTAPVCPTCHASMRWRRAVRVDQITRALASDLGILRTNLSDLGFPADGAMIVVRRPGKRSQRYVLKY